LPIHAPDGVKQKKDRAPLPDEDDDATDTESVLATLTHSSRGPTVGFILLLTATCYAAYAAPMPVLHRPEADDHFDQCFYVAFQEPVSNAEAMRRADAAKWITAMEEEKSAFFTNGTWEIVPTHHTWNLLSSKWVFKIKVDEKGVITRYRARLVAKGFLQSERANYRDIIFSPVVRYSTLRILLALAAHYGLFKRHLDCPKAVIQADLNTPCYMEPPPGMSIAPGFCQVQLVWTSARSSGVLACASPPRLTATSSPSTWSSTSPPLWLDTSSRDYSLSLLRIW
jgi:hypothetical protein